MCCTYKMRFLRVCFGFIVALLGFAICSSKASNILFILPYPVPSHFQCFHPLMVELADRGHNVTVLSSFKPNHDNITFIDFTGAKQYFHASWTALRSQTRLENMITTYEIVKNFMNKALYDENFQQLLNNNDTHFDAVMIEIYYADAYLALAKKYNAPVIGLVPQSLPAVYGWLTSNPISFSYIPNMYLPYTNDMNFFQRLTNSLFGLVHVVAYEMWYYVANQEVVNRHFDFLQSNQKNLKTMLDDVSLLLVNTHYTMGYPRPFLPNIVEVAGMHLKSKKTLPEDIRHFMDKSVNGVVYISFGTMVDPIVVEKWGKVILQVFANQPLSVIWKWNSTLVENIPRNFFIQSWLPQNEILQHSNCKLFITHGGVHSLIETVNAGVPIIGVPFFSDQPLNIANAEKLGFGIGLKDLETEPLRNAVRRIFDNPEYHKNAQHRSKLFKDRLVDPLSTATYWVEHVLRNKGAPHLKSAAAKLTWYQYFMLDVIVFVLVVLFVISYLLAVISTRAIRFTRAKFNSFVTFVIDHNSQYKKVQ